MFAKGPQRIPRTRQSLQMNRQTVMEPLAALGEVGVSQRWDTRRAVIAAVCRACGTRSRWVAGEHTRFPRRAVRACRHLASQ